MEETLAIVIENRPVMDAGEELTMIKFDGQQVSIQVEKAI
jgi:hypothetical protein